MVTIVRKEYGGGARNTTLSFAITSSATAAVVADGSTLPTGASYPFVLEIDRGTDNAEKVLCTARSGNNITISTRNYDGTTGPVGGHAAGATVYHVLDATSLTHLWEHITDTTRDDHTQYLTTARHDLASRHTVGTVISAGITPTSIGTANAEGSANAVARGDHVHKIATGAINASAMFTAGIVDSTALGALAVTAGKINTGGINLSAQFAAGVVDATALGTDAVTTAKILASNVTTAKIADANITQAKLDATVTKEIVQIVTTVAAYSGTPSKGALAYETDNNALKQYQTATTLWTAPWNLSWGSLAAPVLVTVGQGSITTIADLTSLAITVTVPANRLIRVTSLVLTAQATAGATNYVHIYEGATQLARAGATVSSAGGVVSLAPSIVISAPSAGSHTYKLRGEGAGGTFSTAASATTPCYIAVEDLGPTAAPA